MKSEQTESEKKYAISAEKYIKKEQKKAYKIIFRLFLDSVI